MTPYADALKLLAECSPFVPEDLRQRITELYDEAANDRQCVWSRRGDTLVCSPEVDACGGDCERDDEDHAW